MARKKLYGLRKQFLQSETDEEKKNYLYHLRKLWSSSLGKVSRKKMEQFLSQLLKNENDTDRFIAITCFLDKMPEEENHLIIWRKMISDVSYTQPFQKAIENFNGNNVRSANFDGRKGGVINRNKR